MELTFSSLIMTIQMHIHVVLHLRTHLKAGHKIVVKSGWCTIRPTDLQGYSREDRETNERSKSEGIREREREGV